jgi:hypothetical protein
MDQNIEEIIPKIGYLYHYPNLDHPTGKFRLDIYITAEPTEKHFDVLRALFHVKKQSGEIGKLKVTHPGDYEKTNKILAGIVEMEDRKGKKEEAFSFGGQLTIDSNDLQTVCILMSPAPILEISGATAIHRLFIDEVKILLAKMSAKFSDHHEYEKHLINADPLALYLACLKTLLKKFEHISSENERYFQLLMYLHSQNHRLKAAGLFRTPTPKLGEIFGL